MFNNPKYDIHNFQCLWDQGQINKKLHEILIFSFVLNDVVE